MKLFELLQVMSVLDSIVITSSYKDEINNNVIAKGDSMHLYENLDESILRLDVSFIHSYDKGKIVINVIKEGL